MTEANLLPAIKARAIEIQHLPGCAPKTNIERISRRGNATRSIDEDSKDLKNL